MIRTARTTRRWAGSLPPQKPDFLGPSWDLPSWASVARAARAAGAVLVGIVVVAISWTICGLLAWATLRLVNALLGVAAERLG